MRKAHHFIRVADARNYIRGFDASKEGYLAVTGPYGNQFRFVSTLRVVAAVSSD